MVKEVTEVNGQGGYTEVSGHVSYKDVGGQGGYRGRWSRRL